MMQSKADIEKEIKALENEMQQPDFWADKNRAQEKVRELQNLKDELQGVGKFDKGSAVITIFSGAGGDDAEDFSRMLFDMYIRYAEKSGWQYVPIHEHPTEHGGYRNITFELDGKNVYGKLKNESGVHRLVRISPFNANKKRHTSFSLVEVIPKFERQQDFDVPENELKIEYARSSGPGGQNVNKRETAVRVVHEPTGIAVHSEAERSQAQNKERALAILKAKLYRAEEEKRKGREAGFYVSKTTDIEWGSQIRSYVLHPYKMVKDHRTGVEVSDVQGVLDGDLDSFIEAELEL